MLSDNSKSGTNSPPHLGTVRTARYQKVRKRVKTRSLVLYLLQSTLCFLFLGSMLSSGLFQLFHFGVKRPTDGLGLPNFWEVLLIAPIGFALSLLIDRHKAPLKACLPFRSISHKTLLLPNRVFYHQPGTQPGTFRGRRRSALYWTGLSLGLGFPIILASNMLVVLLRYLFPELPTFQMDGVDLIFARYSTTQVFFLVVVSPVIFEELVYRGRGFALLARHWGGTSAALLSSLTFAFAHAGPVEILSLLPLAFYLGWLRRRSGSLGFTMLVHLQNNGLAFLWQLLATA
ncbi:CPBP family intramembrane metalloprotease [Candidatus Haliotispira prima]|uniref:CPBP family intramembrane metalloprotease n=1 Tax=Candidatus Haliotispira prima TaxID=3034016 RepID=A0ABY8MLK0_9SPIO|nr:CPBP family intramembrane metalloprotease [Candidatus Haliotispira prima]